MKVWTETEQKSTRISIVLTYKTRGEKVQAISVIKATELSKREFNQLIKILTKHGK